MKTFAPMPYNLSDIDLVRLVAGEAAVRDYAATPSLRALVFPRVIPAKLSRARRKIEAAREIIQRALAEDLKAGTSLASPSQVKDYLKLRIGSLEHEEFWCVFLDVQLQVIECEQLFRGTLAETTVYPREIVKRALQWNAGAVILAHNHPSGSEDPSTADLSLTRNIREALKLVGVRVVDHFVICANKTVSFAERGLL